jgi:death-on-curing protein
MIEISLDQVLRLHDKILSDTGGSTGLRDQGALESAVAQPRMTFGGQDLYPTLPEKAAALGFSLIQNHPSVDGNKRIGLASTILLIRANGFDLQASVDETEQVVLAVAAGKMSRED